MQINLVKMGHVLTRSDLINATVLMGTQEKIVRQVI